jgi:hypothetical protein
MGFKSVLASLPGAGPLLVRIKRALFGKAARFTNSTEYWERRYKRGGNSGAGSYHMLATFKANVINELVNREKVRSIIEFGSGDGAQLALAKYPSYVGVDVARTALEKCRRMYAHHRFLHISELPTELTADLTLSMDVIYHLIEDETFDAHMNQLFGASDRFVVIYSSNEDSPGQAPHIRHRRFTDWIDRHRPEFKLAMHIPNAFPYDPENPANTSFADFYVFERE